METWDVIVVGSGMGGLTAASLLARLQGARVLVLERHFKLGGFTHTFQRPGGYHWDVGIHYVGRMGEGMPGRRLFDLVTGGAVRWARMADPYDVFEYPGLTVEAHAGPERFEAELCRHFPAERAAIAAYLADLRRVQGYAGAHATARSAPAPISWLAGLAAWRGSGLALQRTGDYLAHRFADPRLRAVAASQWGDYGLPPGQSAFVLHALIAHHYLRGAWYPEGTSRTIADGVIPIVKGAGGDLRVDCDVQEIRVEGGRATGVRYLQRQGGKLEEREARAPVVISDAGAAVTYGRLLPERVAPRARADLARLGSSMSNLTLYLGLREGPQAIGMHPGNRWIYSSFDHDGVFAEAARFVDGGPAPHAYLSFPSAKDPLAKAHTAEVITAAPWEPFARWEAQPWKKRDAEYQSLKERLADRLLDLVEARHPGFKGLVAYRELSTPLTNTHFSNHPRGAIYGVPGVPERWRLPWLGARTPVRGLWLAGADATTLGVMGALMGGVAAAAGVLGARGFPAIFRAAREGAPARPPG